MKYGEIGHCPRNWGGSKRVVFSERGCPYILGIFSCDMCFEIEDTGKYGGNDMKDKQEAIKRMCKKMEENGHHFLYAFHKGKIFYSGFFLIFGMLSARDKRTGIM